jgi:hypothetical protein
MSAHTAGRCAIASLAAAAVLVGARAVFGPLNFPLHIYRPLNVEGVFAVAGLLLLAARTRSAGAGKPARWGRFEVAACAAMALLVFAVFQWTAGSYFLSDDFAMVWRPSWASTLETFHMPGGDGFFRPVGNTLNTLTVLWADANPVRWHTAGFALHALNTILLFVILRRLGVGRLPASFAGCLAAVHGSRPESVLWVAGRFDLYAACFTLAALAAFLCAWEAGGVRKYVYGTLAMAAMAAAMASKESGFACPLLMAAFALYRGGIRQRRGLLAACFAVAAAVFSYRWAVCHGIGGYLTPGGTPEVFATTPLYAANALLVRLWVILFFPVNWTVGPEVWLKAAFAIYAAALVWLFAARAPRRLFVLGLVCTLAAAIPPISQLMVGVDMVHARVFYLPAMMFSLLVAAALEGSRPRAQWAIAAALVAFHSAVLVHNLGPWMNASRIAESACSSAAAFVTGPNQRLVVNHAPHTVDGVYVFANGLGGCVSLVSGKQTQVTILDRQPAAEGGAAGMRLEWDEGTKKFVRAGDSPPRAPQ